MVAILKSVKIAKTVRYCILQYFLWTCSFLSSVHSVFSNRQLDRSKNSASTAFDSARKEWPLEAFKCAIYTTEKLSLVFSSANWVTTVRFEPVTLVSEVTAYTAGALKARIQFFTRMFNCFRLVTNWSHANHRSNMKTFLYEPCRKLFW